MPSKPDSAIIAALSLPSSINNATLTSVSGGSGFASAYKLSVPFASSSASSASQTFFVKISSDTSSSAMFAGEHASLNALAGAVPSLCPRSLGHGPLRDTSRGAFLVTDFLHFGSTSPRKSEGESLAVKLARLHSTPAPTPEGEDGPRFGFPVGTCCGATMQNNSYKKSWAEFYGENRLMGILRECERANGQDAELRNAVEGLVRTVVPRLLGDGHLGGEKGVAPVVVHGDLWSGNRGFGRIGEDGAEGEEVVFDASACWAHGEYEHGIMRMFGGFGAEFWREYWGCGLVEKTEPKGEYDDRVRLYELYHHLNHNALFGGGYKSGAMGIMKGLRRKYG